MVTASCHSTTIITTASAMPAALRTLVGGILAHDQDDHHNHHRLASLAATSSLVPHAHGLCSQVYRINLPREGRDEREGDHDDDDNDEDLARPSKQPLRHPRSLSRLVEHLGGQRGQLCIKRVILDDQPRPHSVELEAHLLARIAQQEGSHAIVPLLAVVEDTSDPFGTVLDLHLPLYPATLSDVLDDPTFLPLPPPPDAAGSSSSPLHHLWSTPTSFRQFVLSTSAQLFAALDFLHSSARIAHRDIKPDNIVLSSCGHLRLIDFGTALDLNADAPRREGSYDVGSAASAAAAAVFQVGTGAYRAPELLFAPRNGYDATKVDLWAAACVVAQFFTAFQGGQEEEQEEFEQDGWRGRGLDSDEEEDAAVDERPSWQRALWDDPSDDEGQSRPSRAQRQPENDGAAFLPPPPSSSSRHSRRAQVRRTTLFDGTRGEIGLASSIFSLLGLPTTETEWVEATHFQPPLHRLPFSPSPYPAPWRDVVQERLVHYPSTLPSSSSSSSASLPSTSSTAITSSSSSLTNKDVNDDDINALNWLVETALPRLLRLSARERGEASDVVKGLDARSSSTTATARDEAVRRNGHGGEGSIAQDVLTSLGEESRSVEMRVQVQVERVER